MRRVLDGGEGDVRGGSWVRSSDRGLRDRFFDNDDGEEEAVRGGESDILVLMGEGDCRSLCTAMLEVCLERWRRASRYCG